MKKPTIEGGGYARPTRETSVAAFRRARPSPRCWPIFTCDGSCWDGRCSGSSEPSVHGSCTYADDLVILCRRGKAEAALQRLREIMGKLKLTVNEEKTRICKAPEGEFDFLVYTIGRMFSARTGETRIGYRPSKKLPSSAWSRKSTR